MKLVQSMFELHYYQYWRGLYAAHLILYAAQLARDLGAFIPAKVSMVHGPRKSSLFVVAEA